MISPECYGYQGNILRVDLSDGKVTSEKLDLTALRKSVGGASLGIKLLSDEMPLGADWSDPANRLFLGAGPLGGTRIERSGAIAVATKGALTMGLQAPKQMASLGRTSGPPVLTPS
jgi:aldehyde:ferredoxin oxidoreductase